MSKKYERIEEEPEYKNLLIKEKGDEITLRSNLVKLLMILFSLGVLSCIVFYFLKGFDLINLSDTLLKYYAGVTVAEVAGIVIIVVKALFKD